MKEKKRLDLFLAEKGFFPSRAKAQAAILAGVVLVDEKKIEKAGAQVPPQAKIRIRGESCPYVSRGGVKLKAALKRFKIKVAGKTALDIGASTGGFTDCLLQEGAKKVFAVDVGYGQLAWKLRQDKRVVTIERTNVRYLTREKLYSGNKKPASLATIDVSFISLDKVLPVVKGLLSSPGEIISLIKPQFEAGREEVEKGGLVRDREVRKSVLQKIVNVSKELGLNVLGITSSPITGADGNVEYFVYLSKDLSRRGLINVGKRIAEIVG